MVSTNNEVEIIRLPEGSRRMTRTSPAINPTGGKRTQTTKSKLVSLREAIGLSIDPGLDDDGPCPGGVGTEPSADELVGGLSMVLTIARGFRPAPSNGKPGEAEMVPPATLQFDQYFAPVMPNTSRRLSRPLRVQ